MAYRYAQIDDSGICVADSILSGPHEGDNLIALSADAPSPLGMLYSDGEFIAPSDPVDTRPIITVTSVTTDDPNNLIQPGDVTCVAGSQVTVNVELRSPADDTVLPVDATFRMPLTARDGRERFLLASFTQGVAAIGTTIDESGCWVIDEETINRDLPEEQHMKFDGLRIFTML